MKYAVIPESDVSVETRKAAHMALAGTRKDLCIAAKKREVVVREVADKKAVRKAQRRVAI